MTPRKNEAAKATPATGEERPPVQAEAALEDGKRRAPTPKEAQDLKALDASIASQARSIAILIDKLVDSMDANLKIRRHLDGTLTRSTRRLEDAKDAAFTAEGSIRKIIGFVA